ncbi:UDP-galactopyranose mutase [Chitinophaga ginsengisegetis]|uniref:UDP-galactopyranose mutase n=1 Tax=Chitinophaga ginsengisegetis TaxID=393003 RepID=UPI000DBA3257|nr:UDP-galactopyranose mutase [Chitinophaga ginsengisegetis]MDR6566551.1 UDP-galactopyranose mutase [Chitinophaga ginsengisegetis]MDR6646281.1 UDP-galactopyranose mutase [Chitinophaga ginsengisegetis]MDR6651126.1 UDP-galactopyranose mutase [Chitinophaga ginsengisegetis]
MKQYDFVIVGAGLFGAVFACEMRRIGKKCLVIDKREHRGGNVYCEEIDNINVHKYGAHIFHTNDKKIWDYVNSFVPFNRYTNSPMANYKGKLYNLPFNMNTFYQLWGVKTPEEAKNKIQEQIAESFESEPKNLEEQALSLVGEDIYRILIKGYTEKQWGRRAVDLPAFIIKRLPVRFTFDNNYFDDKYQGIPIGGYNKLIDGLLEGVEVQLNTDYFEDRTHWSDISEQVVFTGKIDQFFDYKFGVLEYRSLRFETERLETENYQGNAVVNYTEAEVPYTRILEHKHFEFGKQPTTVITKEYPCEWTPGIEPYYPINDEKNSAMFKQYQQLGENETNVIFGGRLAEYRYYDMHQVIGSALKKVEVIKSRY